MEIQVSHTISMGHRLPSYDGICSSPHGHNVRVDVRIDTRGEFYDFKLVKHHLKEVLADLDHAMVLQKDDVLLRILHTMSFRVVALSVEPTTEALAQLVFNEMRQLGYPLVSVTVHETDKYQATANKVDIHTQREKLA